MAIEHKVEVFPIDGELQSKIDALVKDGWDLVPGVLPTAVYHLVRVKEDEPLPTARGILQIDDALVHVIPAGATKQ